MTWPAQTKAMVMTIGRAVHYLVGVDATTLAALILGLPGIGLLVGHVIASALRAGEPGPRAVVIRSGDIEIRATLDPEDPASVREFVDRIRFAREHGNPPGGDGDNPPVHISAA